ncbi:MAG: GIY-YIG nuclease family protein [bacterium]|nr:GIY-YIG nuclease family protein [bacterium]
MHYTYVLLSERDKKLYIGFTSNLKRRFSEHERGEVESTKNRRPLKLVFYEAFQSVKDASRREKYFKTDKGKSSLKQIIRNSIEK